MHARSTLAVAVLQALAALGALHGLGTWWAWRAGLGPALGAIYVATFALLALAAFVSLALLVPGPTASESRPSAGIALAAFLSLALLAVSFSVVLFPTGRLPYAYAAVGLAAGAFSLFRLGYARLRSARVRRTLDRLLVAVCATGMALVASEVTLRVWAARGASVLIADTSEAAARLSAFRLSPGESWFGFPINSRGDNDDEPPRRDEVEHLAVVIGDSFSTAPVPRPLHYTSIAERELPGSSFYNMGAPGFGAREYLHLLVHEALPLEPDFVVIALFVGNDLHPPPPASRRPHPVFDRRAMLLWRAVERLSRVAAERSRASAEGAGLIDEGRRTAPGKSALQAAWLKDPLLEKASMSHEQFFKIERNNALVLRGMDEASLAVLFGYIQDIVTAAGDIPVAILLIPDEFQVEDAVWNELGPEYAKLDRERPQRVLGTWCADHGVSLIDPLPELRALPPLADGARHAYHLRETHWNARGNEVAGKALAAFAARHLGW